MNPTITVIIPARNGHDITSRCLQSCLHTFAAMPDVDFVLVDDASEPSHKIADLFDWFSDQIDSDRVLAIRSDEWLHYTGSFYHGMSHATGENLLLLSNDMMITPSFIEKLLAVAQLHPSFGIVRGVSQWTDSHPEHKLASSPPVRTYADICRFSAHVAAQCGLTYTIDNLLSGDAVLVQRAVIRKVGMFDTQYFGYFGDLEYGIRVQRAGFQLVCAKGAWLHHEGAGHIKHGPDDPERNAKRMALVKAAYDKFRANWCPESPEKWESVRQLDFDLMRERGPIT